MDDGPVSGRHGRARRSRAQQVQGVLWLVFLACLIASFPGLPSRTTQHVAWAAARMMLIPAGAALLGLALFAKRSEQRTMALWEALIGLGMAGIGLHKAFSGPWTLLAVPACALGAAVCLRGAVRGPGDGVYQMLSRSSSSRPRRPRTVRAICGFTALLCAVGAVLAITAA